jgi:hypothetical protein
MAKVAQQILSVSAGKIVELVAQQILPEYVVQQTVSGDQL